MGLIAPRIVDGSIKTKKTCVKVRAGQLSSQSHINPPTTLLRITVKTQVADAIVKSTASALLAGQRSAIWPPRALPREIPASTIPMTAVQVYRDEPRCLAIRRAATSSRTIIQRLEMKTVAAGTMREAPAGFLALIWPFSIAVESMRLPPLSARKNWP